MAADNLPVPDKKVRTFDLVASLCFVSGIRVSPCAVNTIKSCIALRGLRANEHNIPADMLRNLGLLLLGPVPSSYSARPTSGAAYIAIEHQQRRREILDAKLRT